MRCELASVSNGISTNSTKKYVQPFRVKLKNRYESLEHLETDNEVSDLNRPNQHIINLLSLIARKYRDARPKK